MSPESSPCRSFSNQIHSDYFLITCTILLPVEVMRRSKSEDLNLLSKSEDLNLERVKKLDLERVHTQLYEHSHSYTATAHSNCTQQLHTATTHSNCTLQLHTLHTATLRSTSHARSHHHRVMPFESTCSWPDHHLVMPFESIYSWPDHLLAMPFESTYSWPEIQRSEVGSIRL